MRMERVVQAIEATTKTTSNNEEAGHDA
jgi:hypothetical protein